MLVFGFLDPERGHAAAEREWTMTSVRARSRELAERLSSGTRVRLLWRQGTKRVWIEVQEPDRVLAILVPPERALDAFHHPYAYAGPHNLLPSAESIVGS
jgi:hypothetical protein